MWPQRKPAHPGMSLVLAFFGVGRADFCESFSEICGGLGQKHGQKPEISRKLWAARRSRNLSLSADRSGAQGRAIQFHWKMTSVCAQRSLKFRESAYLARGGRYLPLPPAKERNEI